jgi:hypothetical protein
MDCICINGATTKNLLLDYNCCYGNTLHQCFTTNLSLRCSKFLGVEETTPMEPGWNAETHYLACNFTYKNCFPCLGNPDDFHACCDYVKKKVKWHSF